MNKYQRALKKEIKKVKIDFAITEKEYQSITREISIEEVDALYEEKSKQEDIKSKYTLEDIKKHLNLKLDLLTRKEALRIAKLRNIKLTKNKRQNINNLKNYLKNRNELLEKHIAVLNKTIWSKDSYDTECSVSTLEDGTIRVRMPHPPFLKY